MKMFRMLALLLLMPLPAHAAGNWHLLTQSVGGVVSLVSRLSKSDCEHAMNLILGVPSTAKEKEAVQREFERGMLKQWADLARQKEWQKSHQQCKHVEWWASGGTCSGYNRCSSSSYSKEDLSGKDGKCSVDGNGFLWRGIDDDLTAWNPDTNPRLAEVQKSYAMKKFGFTPNDGIKFSKCFE